MACRAPPLYHPNMLHASTDIYDRGASCRQRMLWLNVCMEGEKNELTCRTVMCRAWGSEAAQPLLVSAATRRCWRGSGGYTGGELSSVQKQADIEKTVDTVVDTVGVKMGVAVFAPCLHLFVVVVNGCFAATRPPKKRNRKKKLALSPNEYEINKNALYVRVIREVSQNDSKDIKTTKGQKNTEGLERRRRWCWASLGSHDGRRTSVKRAGMQRNTSGCRFQSKIF